MAEVKGSRPLGSTIGHASGSQTRPRGGAGDIPTWMFEEHRQLRKALLQQAEYRSHGQWAISVNGSTRVLQSR